MRLETAADIDRLAAAPGPPCVFLQLPPPPLPKRDCPTAWAAQQQLVAAAERLLRSPAFLRRSGTTLTALSGCPRAAAEHSGGLLAAYPALEELQLEEGLTIGNPGGLRGSSLGRCSPALRRLQVTLPASGCVVSHVADWPSRLQQCTLVAGSGGSGGGGSGGMLVSPCSCFFCNAAAASNAGGFWATCKALQVLTGGTLALHLGQCRQLRSCTSLRVSATGDASAAPSAALAAEAPDAILQRWLAALAPLFAATPLQVLELKAAAASLRSAASDGQPVLLVGSGQQGMLEVADHPGWPPAELATAAMDEVECLEERLGGLAAELRRAAGSSTFLLRVYRCGD